MENLENKDRRKLSAIMFVDIVGYSKLMGKDEESTFSLLEDYKDIVSPIVKEYQGRIVKWLGDGLFCEFGSAISAADCAIRIHQEISEYNKQDRIKFKINIRVGIHLGEVTRKDNDLFGDGVNVAARIEPQAPKGGIAISGVVYSVLKSYPRFEISKMDERPLKNIDFDHGLFSIKTGFETDEIAIKHINNNGDRRYWTNRWKSVISFKNISTIVFVVGTIAAIVYYLPHIVGVEKIPGIEEESIQNNGLSDNQKAVIFSAKYQDFYKQIVSRQNSENIINFLLAEQKAGKLSFGNESDFHSPDKKCIIVLDGYNLSTVVISLDGNFIDLNDIQVKNIKPVFVGNRLIWVELY